MIAALQNTFPMLHIIKLRSLVSANSTNLSFDCSTPHDLSNDIPILKCAYAIFLNQGPNPSRIIHDTHHSAEESTALSTRYLSANAVLPHRCSST